MSKLGIGSLFALAIAAKVATASTPFVPPTQPLAALTPLAIIEGGTVMSVPKSKKGGKVTTLKPRAEQRKARPAANTMVAKHAPSRAKQPAPVKTCACASGGGSSSDVVELRSTETGLKVVVLGADGLTRTRFVPAPPGSSTARHNQEE